jgi:hypothetical protein
LIAQRDSANAESSLLAVRSERRGERGDEATHEGATVHSMTCSARSSSDGGMVRPSAFAVFMLTRLLDPAKCSSMEKKCVVRFAKETGVVYLRRSFAEHLSIVPT